MISTTVENLHFLLLKSLMIALAFIRLFLLENSQLALFLEPRVN